MRKNFEVCLGQTLIYEGGYSNNAHDPGGATMNGVTQRVYNIYRQFNGREVQSVKLLLPIERDDIYRAGYWDLVQGDQLPSGVDMALFDYAVNSGASRPNRVYRSIQPCEPVQAIRKICASRLAFMQALSTWQYFGAGWGRRVGAVELFALRLAAGGGLPETSPSKADAKTRADKSKAQSKITTTTAAAPAGASLHPAALAGGSHYWLWAIAAMLVFVGVLMALEAFHQNNRATELAKG